MTLSSFKITLLTIFFLAFSAICLASDKGQEDEKFDPKEMILHHVKDAHEFHLFDWNKKPISIPLPIILWTENGLTIFMSSHFHHDDEGKTIVKKWKCKA